MGWHPEQREGSGLFAWLKPGFLVALLLGMTEDSLSAVGGVPGLPYGE